MKQYFTKINVSSHGQKLYEITNDVNDIIANHDISEGLITLYIKHTSASLLIQEKADDSVLRDLQKFYDRLAPQDIDLYEHNTEGSDDMPAHIKSSLTSTQLTIPIKDKKITMKNI